MQDRSYPRPPGGNLSAAHSRVLEGSGIAPEVIAERRVRTVRKGRGQLPSTYSRRQKKRAPGILFTVHRPNGQTATIFRPDEPDPKNPGHKYEQESKHHGGAGNVLDVHPSVRHLLADERVTVVFTEGIKKADAITSAARAAGVDLLAVAISGVWNWMSGGEPISDMLDVPVKGRRTLIGFDSDMVRNPQVQDAAEQLAEHLTRREADLEIVYLPDQPDGSKNGADDFLVGGATLVELMALARPYRPGDLQREKLTRNEKLRRVLADLTRREEEIPAKSQRGCSMRSAWRVCLTLAEKRGQLVGDGIQVVVPLLTGAEMAAVGKSTFAACLADFVEQGLARRIKRQRSDHADSYVLLGGVLVGNDGEAGGPEKEGQRGGEERDAEREDDPGFRAIPPLPEMRWSAPGRKARRGLVEGTRRVRQGKPLAADTPSKRRPGKKRDEVVRYLVEKGGAATRAELLERFGGSKTTWRDFKKQTLADLLGRRRQYRDQPLSVGPPVVELTDEGIRFVAGWAEAWQEHRTIGAEQEAADEQKRNHMMQRIAYRRRNEKPADPGPGEAEEESADGFIEELQPEADDWRGHPLDCECQGCLCAPTTAYVRIRGGA